MDLKQIEFDVDLAKRRGISGWMLSTETLLEWIELTKGLQAAQPVQQPAAVGHNKHCGCPNCCAPAAGVQGAVMGDCTKCKAIGAAYKVGRDFAEPKQPDSGRDAALMRSKFEAWYAPLFGDVSLLGDSDQYRSNHAQGMWCSWRSALAAHPAPASDEASECKLGGGCKCATEEGGVSESCKFYLTAHPANGAQAGLSDAQIREIFIANGFTVKEGQSDLKDYVYKAAHALLATTKKG